MQRLIFSIILSLGLLTVGASAVPDIPMIINGNVFLDGSPAPAGTKVIALMDGEVIGSSYVIDNGVYGMLVRSDKGSNKIDIYVNGILSDNIDMSNKPMSLNLQAVTSPPPIPNTFSGKVKIINQSGEFNAAEGTLIEAFIDGTIKGTTTVTKEGSYIIDVRGDNSDDGKNIIFRVGGRSDTSSFFYSSNPPPRSKDIEIRDVIPPVSVCGQDRLACENVGTAVKFNGSASYDPDGLIVSYAWDFGDGMNGTGAELTHKYISYRWNGTSYQPFTVNLTVTDNNGLTNMSSNKVVIWIAGDVNGDGKVNILDASTIGLKWGKTNEPCADLNNDGNVNIIDASIIGLNWMRKA
jgi:hypothetical protein